MDFFADKCIEKVIRELCDNYYKPNKEEWKYWKYLTEQMLKQISVKEIIDYILNISEGLSDEQWKQKYPFEIFIEQKEEKPIKVYGKSNSYDIINKKLKITEVAKRYGLKVKKNKAICPFHNDTDPSLSLNDEKNVFFCHGCHAKGDIITFIKKLEANKYDNKKAS